MICLLYKIIKKAACLILVILFSIQASGCGIFSKKSDENTQKADQLKNPPKSLVSMEEKTEEIVSQIEEVKKNRKKQERELIQPSKAELEKNDQAQDQESDQKQDQKENKDQSKDQEANKQDKGQEQGDQEKQVSQAKQILVNWNELEASIEQIHKMWNSYEPAAIQEGILDDLITSFEEDLNLLTEAILSRDEDKTLKEANSLYSHYSCFLNAYKHRQPPDIKQMKYLTRQAIIYGQEDKWEDAKVLMPALKKAWENSKLRMSEKNNELIKKIDAIINDFSFLIDAEKINLAQIKGDILLSNLDEVE